MSRLYGLWMFMAPTVQILPKSYYVLLCPTMSYYVLLCPTMSYYVLLPFWGNVKKCYEMW